MGEMMKIKIVILAILAVLPPTGLANTVIAKERAPSEGLYIVGPDISPDSSGYLHLYYSPDGGHTLEVRNVFDWYSDIRTFTVDYDHNTVYIAASVGGFLSRDGGYTFPETISSGAPMNLRSGVVSGIALRAAGMLSNNYGTYWYAPAFEGYYSPYYVAIAELGVLDSVGYNLNSDGVLFFSDDYFENVIPVFDFGSRVHLFRGVQPGEVYAQIGDTIYHSIDNGSSFTLTGSLPPVERYHDLEVIAGNFTGELIAAAYTRFIIPHMVYKGGSIEIWRSSDHGETWEMIRNYHAAVQEPVTHSEKNECFFTQQGNIIFSEETTTLYDLHGRLLSKGKAHDLSDYAQGLFFISNNEQTQKIVNIK